MTAHAGFSVNQTARNIPGLENGKRYIMQNQGSVQYVEYCNYATNPTADGVNVSWFRLYPRDFLDTGTYDAALPLWVRMPQDVDVDYGSFLAIGEK